MSRRGLYSIAPHAPFLPLLADRILDGTLLNGWDRSGPFWLADVTIFLPTRRSRLMLAEIFAQRLGGTALLPDIRTFGGENAEEEPFLPPADAPAPRPVASVLERRLTLSRLVRLYAETGAGFASPPNAAEVLWLADSLGTVIDDFTIEDVRPERLAELVTAELAENWQQILEFLRIVFEAWPQVLAERGEADAAAVRNETLRRQAGSIAARFGDRPVIAAGSTGSIPATAALLKAIAGLERGAVVLPGLDTTLTADQHEQLLDGAETHGHPQYGLMQLLRGLGAGVADVEELGGAAPRTMLVRAALARAEETAAWGAWRKQIDVAAGLDGVGVLAAPNADIEARAIAVAARAAVAEGKSVGIVSRDQTLARRVAVELGRHGIVVDDPAGTPLYQSAAGRLARQALAVVSNRFAPVHVVALLRNAAVGLGYERDVVRRLTNSLDMRLRGKRTRPGLFGVLAIAEDDEIKRLLETLGERLVPLSALFEAQRVDAAGLAAAVVRTVEGLAGSVPHEGPPPLTPPRRGEGDTSPGLPGMLELRAWAAAVSNAGDAGAPFPPRDLDAVLAALTAGSKTEPGPRRRDDVHIWGELEARLMSPDLLILAGVNEDIWPGPADPGPWMNRTMRMAVGLMPPERRQGQAAHDFEMALGNAEVLVSYALRIGTSPALPSRFLQRLDAFVGDDAGKNLRARGKRWIEMAEAIDFAGVPQAATRPAPMPSADKRPRRLSITEIEPLMRSPYDIYARRVLRLGKRDPLGAEPDAKDRGNMIHKVFERFVEAGSSFDAADALVVLEKMAEEEFAGLEAIGERRDIWLRRFRRAAELFLDYERERDEIVERTAEKKGEWLFPHLQNFVLVGKADRIDRRRDGKLEILDFKTGGVPAAKDMTAFDAPQLLLEAAMARAAQFPDIGAADTAELTYLKIGLGPQAFHPIRFRLRKGMPLMAAVDEIERRLQGHVEAFLLRSDRPMAARIRPRVETGRKQRPGDYDHLARTDEWTLTAGVDDP